MHAHPQKALDKIVNDVASSLNLGKHDCLNPKGKVYDVKVIGRVQLVPKKDTEADEFFKSKGLCNPYMELVTMESVGLKVAVKVGTVQGRSHLLLFNTEDFKM